MEDIIRISQWMDAGRMREELRHRRLSEMGTPHNIQDRLIAAFARDFVAGWTLGPLLDTMIVPFTGEGIDPKKLVGHHIVEVKRNEDGTMTLELSDGADQQIVTRSSGAVTFEVFSEDFEGFMGGRKDPPLLIVEAAMGVRRMHYGGPTFTVIGIKCEGMKNMAFFLPGMEEVSWPAPRLHWDALLVEEKEKSTYEGSFR